MYLVAWEKITQEKGLGGLGIKNLEKQNQAFIMKLCWGLITKPDALWVKCLKSVYECGEHTIPQVAKKRTNSPTWQTITSVWGKFLKVIGSKLHNGKGTRFWWDMWTNLEKPLIEYVTHNHERINHEAFVADFVLDSRR